MYRTHSSHRQERFPWQDQEAFCTQNQMERTLVVILSLQLGLTGIIGT